MALRLKSNPAPLSGALFVSNPRRKRKKVVRRKKRSNTGKVRTRMNRRNGTKKGAVRKTARRAYAKKRKNTRSRIIRKNPMEFKFLKPVEKLVGKIPLIGKKVAPYTQPALVAMVGGASIPLAMRGIGQIPVVGEYAKWVYGNAFGYTLMGITLAGLSTFLPLKPANKKAIALACAAAGGAINAAQLAMNGFNLQAVMLENHNILGASTSNGVDESVAGLGDGMYYEVAPLGGISISPQHLGNAHQVAHHSGYESTSLADATACPSDLAVHEGKAALLGKEAYMQVFGPAPRRMSGQKTAHSACAGVMGHRWGWLVKSLGWERFKKLAKMQPQARQKMIAQLKSAALQAAQSSFDQNVDGALSGISISRQNSLSGLSYSMNGLSYEGLAVDNMAGLASIGAGV